MKSYLMVRLFINLCLFLLLVSNLQAEAKATILRQIPGESPQDVNEKQRRTPTQEKIDSQLLLAVQLKRQGIRANEIDVPYDSSGRVAVDISAQVNDKLLATIRREGGEVVNSYTHFKSVRAYLTLESLEIIASLSEVRFISRAAKAELSIPTAPKEDTGQSKPKSYKVMQPRISPTTPPAIQSRRKKRRRTIKLAANVRTR